MRGWVDSRNLGVGWKGGFFFPVPFFFFFLHALNFISLSFSLSFFNFLRDDRR